MKKLLSLLLAVMMVVSLLPVSAFAEMAQGEMVEQTPEPVAEPQADESTLVTSGKAGDNITWNYDEATKVLTFSGKGEMMDNVDFDFVTAVPYFAYPVEKIVVEEGITSIGTWMIYFGTDPTFENDKGNDTVTAIELPSSLTSIHEGAFGGLNKLEKLVIPEGVTTIGEQIVENSIGIKELVLPDSVTEIYSNTYGNNTGAMPNLERIVLPKNITAIPEKAFNKLTKLNYIVLPSGITKIGNNAFSNCTALKEITIPASVTEIGNSVFYNWTADQTINFELTEEEVKSKVTFGSDWSGKATIKYGGGHPCYQRQSGRKHHLEL